MVNLDVGASGHSNNVFYRLSSERHSGCLPNDKYQGVNKSIHVRKRTGNTDGAYKLVHQIDLQVWHIDALRVVPLVAAVDMQWHWDSKFKRQTKKDIPVTSNHDSVLVVASFADTIELVIDGVLNLPVRSVILSGFLGFRRGRHNRRRS